MTHAPAHHNTRLYVWIWGALVALLVLGLPGSELDRSKSAALLPSIAIAAVKAVLVLRNYMHLHNVPPMLYALIGVPLLLAIGMALTLMPDIAFR
jgi:caa(3)-type oxidase subunit IV